MIVVRFELVTDAGHRGGRKFLARYRLGHVPRVGELVSVKGRRFLVGGVRWEVDDAGLVEVGEIAEPEMTAVVDVFGG